MCLAGNEQSQVRLGIGIMCQSGKQDNVSGI